MEQDPTTLVDQGRAAYRRGEFNEALSYLDRALEQFRAHGNREQEAETSNDIGVIYTGLREWTQAEKWLTEAHRCFVELQDYDGEAQTLGNLGSMFRARGDLKQAAANLQMSASRFHLIGDEERRGATLRVLSVVRLSQFRFLQALAAYETALACLPHPTAIQRLLRKLFALPLRLLQR
jgi:tetratricopeptide (TPR) repeat protein